jgi:sporulation protein YlmC with PRC-barrel domain
MGDHSGQAIDAVLHLLDRQIVDRDGRMVCKVDDVELTVRPDGTWEVTGLLAGPAALVPRFGGKLGARLERAWGWLGIQQGDRRLPYRIPLALVAELGSGVELLAGREGVLQRQASLPPASGEVRHRLNDILHLGVHATEGGPLGQVLDVRLTRVPAERMELVIQALVVGRGRPGSYLGYDRDRSQGPWLLNRLVRRLHRHSGLVPWSAVRGISWDQQVITVSGPLLPLDHA